MKAEITEKMLMAAILKAVEVELITGHEYDENMVKLRPQVRAILEAALNEH